MLRYAKRNAPQTQPAGAATLVLRAYRYEVSNNVVGGANAQVMAMVPAQQRAL